jgi:hypothetical protein
MGTGLVVVSWSDLKVKGSLHQQQGEEVMAVSEVSSL